MENYSASYRDEMHARYLELVSTDNPSARPKSQWAAENWRVYNHEQDAQKSTVEDNKE